MVLRIPSACVRQSHSSHPPFAAQHRKQCAFVSGCPGHWPLLRHPLQPPCIACALNEFLLPSAYFRKSPACCGPPLIRCARIPVVSRARALRTSVVGACMSSSSSASGNPLPLLIYFATVWLIGMFGVASQLCCIRIHSIVSWRVAAKHGSLIISVSPFSGFSYMMAREVTLGAMSRPVCILWSVLAAFAVASAYALQATPACAGAHMNTTPPSCSLVLVIASMRAPHLSLRAL